MPREIVFREDARRRARREGARAAIGMLLAILLGASCGLALRTAILRQAVAMCRAVP